MKAVVGNRNKNIMLWLLFPLVIVAIVGYFIIMPSESYLKEVAGFFVMTVAMCCFLGLFLRTRLQKTILVFCYLVLAFFAFTKLSFYLEYGVGISASALFVIFETNSNEASEYLTNYFGLETIILALGLSLPLVFLLKWKYKHANVTSQKPRLRQLATTAVLIFIGLGSLFLIKKKFKKENIPYAAITTWNEYKIAKQNLKDNLAQPESAAFTNVVSTKEPQTYVVVIGESTSRWHMQLYGYERETNPKLNEIKNELLVMDSIITPHVHTITALEKILTLANAETTKPDPNGSIIQLANQAGFTTYWLSNQKPVGLYESIPTILGSAAQHTRFLATEDYNQQILDENLIPELTAILAKKEISKKVIFIHLIGTHLRYEKRYPKKYDIFQDTLPSLQYLHNKAITQTNTYDNAVLYNDAVVRDIIEVLRAENRASYMVYFSDHGDEVYDTMDFLGHNEYHGTRPMFEVPMVFWFSEKYNIKSDSLRSYRGRKYSLERFPHTFAQLSNIQFQGYDATQSVLDSTFMERPRIIKETQDYDQK